MINYEEELKKFKPCLDVDEVENAIYTRDLTDIVDILKEMQTTDGQKRTEEGEPDELYELWRSAEQITVLSKLRISCGDTEEGVVSFQHIL